jgi:hypothetical protein
MHGNLADTDAEENGIMSFGVTLAENGTFTQLRANAQTSMQDTTAYDDKHKNGDFSTPTLTVKELGSQQ